MAEDTFGVKKMLDEAIVIQYAPKDAVLFYNPAPAPLKVDALDAMRYTLWETYPQSTQIICHPTVYRNLEFALERFKGWPRKFILFPRLDRIEKKIHRLRARFRWWREERRA